MKHGKNALTRCFFNMKDVPNTCFIFHNERFHPNLVKAQKNGTFN